MKELVGKGEFATIYKENGFLYKEISKKHTIGEIFTHIKKNLLIQEVYNIPKTYEIVFLEDKYVVKKDYVTGEVFLDYIMKNPNKTEELIKKMVEKQHQFCDVHVKLGENYKERIIKLLRKGTLENDLKERMINELELMSISDNLCHGDYHPLNIIINKEELFVIDWDNAMNGDELFDIARSFVLLYINNEQMARLYYNKYKEIMDINDEEFKKYLSYIGVECLNEPPNCKNKEALWKLIKREVIL